jgi:DNA polymerase III sliding clamp (beta) subunit (PCNA family)
MMLLLLMCNLAQFYLVMNMQSFRVTSRKSKSIAVGVYITSDQDNVSATGSNG